MASSTKTWRLNNIFGGINTVAEQNALFSFDVNGNGTGCELRDCENYAPAYRGGLSRVKGFSVFKNTGTASPITGLYRFAQSDGAITFMFSQGTRVYKLIAGTSTQAIIIASGDYPNFETAMDTLIVCDGASAKTWDGTTDGTLADAPNGARGSLWYQNRLWIFTTATANSSYVYYSDPSTLDTNMDINFVSCDLNDGQRIVSISKYFIPGQLEPVILVNKTGSSGIIIGDGSTDNPYTYIRTNQDVGGASRRGVVQFGQDIAYLTLRGVTSYKVDNSITNFTYNYISEKVRPNFLNLNPDALGNSIAWYDWRNSRISYAVPEAGKSTPNVIYHFDTRLQCWYKERWGANQDCTSSFVDERGVWYHGDSSGKIYVHDGSGTFDGQGINAFVIFPFLDFGDPNLYKRIVQAKIMLRSSGTVNLGITATYDYGARVGNPSILTNTGTMYKWGQGKWNNTGIYKWGKSPIKFLRYFPGGSFQTMQLAMNQLGSNVFSDIFEMEFITEYTGLQ
jgi:hypothetical protein